MKWVVPTRQRFEAFFGFLSYCHVDPLARAKNMEKALTSNTDEFFQ